MAVRVCLQTWGVCMLCGEQGCEGVSINEREAAVTQCEYAESM